jgi:predicted amidohydrolase YtcJ
LSADLVLINANIRTMNPNQPTAQALAINKNKIVKVGTNKQIGQLINEKTKVLNFEGKTVVPGLIDTHIHVADFGRCLMWLDLTSAQSMGELQSMLEEKARQTPVGKWIVGRGWNQDRFKEKRMPQTSDLDECTPNNPVILYHETAMICAVNTKALQIAGVTKQTVVPSGGLVDQNPENSELTGILRNSATHLIWQAIPEPTVTELLEATSLACQKISSAGITSVHWLVLSEVELEIIQNLNALGRLPFRVNVVVPQELLEKTVGFKTNNVSAMRVGGATIAADGYLDSKEAALLEPYSDEPKNSGKLLCTEKELAASVAKVLAAGVQPIILAMGDKAIDMTLKIIEQTQKGNVRFRIEQAAVLNKDLIYRLKNQEVVISIQPKVISTEFSVWSAIQRLGLERARWLHPLKTLLKEGVKIAGGSDCPMEPLSPLLGIQEVVLRTEFPEQRLSVEDALRMYTLDAAYSSGEDNVKGSIEEGKLADLTVLSDDPMAVEPKKIKNIKVEFIIVDGKILIV